MRTFRLTFLMLVTLTFSAVPAGAHDACASGHVDVRLTAFSEGSVSLPLYWVAESDGAATVTILIVGSNCDGSPSSVTWEVQPGTAGTGDYSPATTPFQWFNFPGHPPTQQREVTITNDLLGVRPLEAGLETARVAFTGGENVKLLAPTAAELIILDDDAPAPSISLVDGPYEESESSPGGGVPVFRAGNASGTTSVEYALGGGSATPGADYDGPASGTLTFVPGDRVELIPIPVVDDAEQEQTETIQVSISGPEVDVQGTSAVTFTIRDNEERLAPSSSLHHPNQGKRYKASKYLIREIHIFTKDEGPAGVVAAEFALRRNMKKGSCAWWVGRKFKKGKCEAERWLKTQQYETDFFYFRLKELPASIGKIRNYTAFSRAIDGARNIESDFQVGRNANTFEIKKPRR